MPSRRAVRRLAPLLAGVIASAAPLLAEPGHAAATDGSPLAEIATEANWIESAQMPSGPIAVWPDRPELLSVEPYQANYAAIGLARASQLTGNMSYANAAWSYLRWYASAEQAGTGYVTDYTITDGTELVSTGSYDSTDAYAGTFLTAVWDTYVATDSSSSLAGLSSGVAAALSAIASTQQPDGLTWATPSYQVAYLMDQAETYGGLEAASDIEQALGNSALASQAARRAGELAAGVAALWNPATASYNWALQANGYEKPTSWDNFYPDGLEQVWAVEWGLVPSARAAELMAQFASRDPQWSDPTATANYLTNATVAPQAISYWPAVSIALNSVGQRPAAATGLSGLMQAASAAGNAWPFTVGDAGQAIVAASGMPLLLPGGTTNPGAGQSTSSSPSSTTTTTTTASTPTTTTTTALPTHQRFGPSTPVHLLARPITELSPAPHGPSRRALPPAAFLVLKP